jgi:hypothetical protein
MTVRQELEKRLNELPGIERRPSRYGHGASYFTGGREIAHFHGETRMDVRLTKEEIRLRKEEGTLDRRLRTRGPSAEWAEVHIEKESDILFAIALVEDAVRANS